MLLIEQLGQDAIIDAIWTIDRINKIGYQAIELNEAVNKGLLSESKSALLMEDLEKAKQELTASGQSSLQKIDKAVKYIEDLLAVVRAGESSEEDIFAQLALSFGKAKNIVAELSALKLDGKIANLKSFFSEGGKIAAIMDALAQEMNILAGFVKMISAAFAQTIRLMQGIPDGFKKTDQGKNKDVTLSVYIGEAAGNGTLSDFVDFKKYEVDAEEMESSLLDIMEDVKEKAGGGGMFSFKGMKNFFSNNAKSIGVGAFLGGLATLATGGLALGPLALAGAAGAGFGAKIGAGKRKPESPAKAYDTTMKDLAKDIMATNVSKLEGLLPGFVKAVKGTNPGEFAKYADEAAKAIQTINIGFDVPDEINKFVKDYDGTYPQFKQLYETDPDTLETIISQLVGGGNFDTAVKDYKDTTLAEPLKQFYDQVMGESSWYTGDLILEAGELAHNYTMSELLFEKSTKAQKKEKAAYKKSLKMTKAKGKQQLSKTEKTPSGAKQNAKAVDTFEKSRIKKHKNRDHKKNITKAADGYEKKIIDAGKESPSEDKETKKPGSGVSKAEYKKYKSGMSEKGKNELRKAEADPQEKNSFEKAVDDYEDMLNKKMVNKQRKTNITKIADEFEKKIKAIDDEEKQESQPDVKPENEESDTAEDAKQEESTSTEDTNTEDTDTEETTSATVDFELPDVPVFKELKSRIENKKTITDKQKKFISILYGDKLSDAAAKSLGIKKEGASDSKDDSFAGTLFGESYDRRLLKMAGVS